MNYCPHCGKKLGFENSNFCPSCGHSLKSRPTGSSTLENEILDLLRTQQFIQAVKIYRERTTAGLKESKEAVEAIAQKYQVPLRNRSPATVLSVAVAFFILILGVVLIFFFATQ